MITHEVICLVLCVKAIKAVSQRKLQFFGRNGDFLLVGHIPLFRSVGWQGWSNDNSACYRITTLNSYFSVFSVVRTVTYC